MLAQGRDPQEIEDALSTFRDKQQRLGEKTKFGFGEFLG
jgi:hypothetical protein